MKKLAGLIAGCLIMSTLVMPVSAYTEEEKAFAKSMLQAYGYSPDWAGANQAYQDYLSGKYNDICEQYGLPKQNVQEEPSSDGSDGADGEQDQDGKSQEKQSGSGTGQTTDQGAGDSAEDAAMPVTGEENTVDDGRFHFNQIRSAEGIGNAELLDILVGNTVMAPIALEGAECMSASEGMVYIDLVFEVTNEGEAPMEADDFLEISVNDGQNEYPGTGVLAENENADGFLESAVLNPGEKKVLHCLAEVPEESSDYVGIVNFAGDSYEVYFDRDTHPKNRKRLEKGSPVQRPGFGLITVDGVSISEREEGTVRIEVPVSLTNLREETIDPHNMAGMLAASGKGIYRAALNMGEGQTIGNREEANGMFAVTLPKGEWEAGGRLFVYFGGVWYQISAEND